MDPAFLLRGMMLGFSIAAPVGAFGSTFLLTFGVVARAGAIPDGD